MTLPAKLVADPNAQVNFDLLGELIYEGIGDPNGRVIAKGAALYFRLDCAAGSAVYAHTSPGSSSGWTVVA